MKIPSLRKSLFLIVIMLSTNNLFSQPPNLGILSSFIIYTTAGAISSTGSSQLTGNVGNKDAGAITGLNAANVNGTIYNAVDSVTTKCAADLQVAYDSLNAAIPTVIRASGVFGNGETLGAGVYTVAGAGSLSSTLILDGASDSSSVFIFKIHGALSTSASSSIILTNRASPCNIFWLVEGLLSTGATTSLKGTYIVNNSAIALGANNNIEGRLISTTGAISFASLVGEISKGCVSNYWTGAAGSSDWFNKTNWTASVPDGIAKTLIPSHIVGGNVYPVISSGTAIVNNLTIENPGSLMVSNATIQVKGTIINLGTLDVSNATVEMNGGFPQLISANTFTGNLIKNLIISNNLNSAGELNITNNILFGSSNKTLNTGNLLTLRSTSTGTAQIADITNGGINSGNTISGDVTLERFIPAKRAWRLLAVPITAVSKQTINSAWQEGVTSGNPAPGYGTHITGGSVGSGFDQILNDSSSLQIFNNSTNRWTNIPANPGTNIPINTYPGYFLFIRGNRSTDLLQGINAPVSPTTLRIKGGVNTGAIVSNINATNLTVVSNPYPAAIDFHTVIKNNVNDKLYLYDPKLGGSNGVGGYVTLLWNGTAYDTTAAISAESQFIASGAAFLVESLDGINPGSLTFNETDKNISGSDNIFRPMAIPQKLRVNLLGINFDNSTDLIDGVLTTYSDQNTNIVDRADAAKIPNFQESISIARNATPLSIERRHTIINKDTTFLNIDSLKQQNYKLQITTLGMATSGITALVKDNYSALNNNTTVNMDGLTEVNFTTNTDVASYSPTRFNIVLIKPIPVPVTIYDEKAYLKQNNIIVDWKTATELDIKNYEVQVSENGNTFTSSVSLSPKANNGGSAHYNWIDVNAALKSGLHYYRIRAMEINGNFIYSQIVKISIGANNLNIGVFINGNIINGNYALLQFNNIEKGAYKIKLYTADGQLLKQLSMQFPVSVNSSFNFDIGNNLPAGRYQIQLTGKTSTYNTWFMKL